MWLITFLNWSLTDQSWPVTEVNSSLILFSYWTAIQLLNFGQELKLKSFKTSFNQIWNLVWVALTWQVNNILPLRPCVVDKKCSEDTYSSSCVPFWRIKQRNVLFLIFSFRLSRKLLLLFSFFCMKNISLRFVTFTNPVYVAYSWNWKDVVFVKLSINMGETTSALSDKNFIESIYLGWLYVFHCSLSTIRKNNCNSFATYNRKGIWICKFVSQKLARKFSVLKFQPTIAPSILKLNLENNKSNFEVFLVLSPIITLDKFWPFNVRFCSSTKLHLKLWNSL